MPPDREDRALDGFMIVNVRHIQCATRRSADRNFKGRVDAMTGQKVLHLALLVLAKLSNSLQMESSLPNEVSSASLR